RASPGARWRHLDGRSPLPIRLRSVSPAVAWQGGLMSDRVREMFELCSSVLFDIDDAGRLLIGNDESGSTQLYELAPDGRRSALTALGEPGWGRSRQGQRAVVVPADDGGPERAQLWLCTLDSDTPRLEPLVADPAYIHTLLDVAADRVVYATNRRNGV